MKLKKFLEENEVTGFEIIQNQLIINAITEGGATYGLNVDTSNIENGTPLTIETEFTIEDDILTVGGIVVNTEEIEMLLSDEEVNSPSPTEESE
jgi:hypothetical protein